LHDPQLLNHAVRLLHGRLLHGRRAKVCRIDSRPSPLDPQGEGIRSDWTRTL
jgi:hypothetical protein